MRILKYNICYVGKHAEISVCLLYIKLGVMLDGAK